MCNPSQTGKRGRYRSLLGSPSTPRGKVQVLERELHLFQNQGAQHLRNNISSWHLTFTHMHLDTHEHACRSRLSIVN